MTTVIEIHEDGQTFVEVVEQTSVVVTESVPLPATVVEIPTQTNVVSQVTGAPGAPGAGVPTGGTTGQILSKKSNANYDTQWLDAAAGGATSWEALTGKPSTFTPSAHTHAIADTTGLQAALDGKQAAGSYAATSHTHIISNVTGLQAALDAKQAAGSYASATHTHTASGITDFNSAVDARISSVVGAAPAALDTLDELAAALGDDANFAASMATSLAGKSDIGHVHTIANVTNLQGTLDGKAPSSHAHTIANVTGLQSALDGKAAATHTHAIADTTGLQAALDGKQAAGSYAAASHTHAASDINSGTVAPARLGSGTTDATTVLYGDGTWKTAPTGGGGGVTLPIATSDVTGLDAALTSKAADSAVIHLAGTETITGAKTFGAGFTMADGQNIIVGSTGGTRFGTATTQKLSFFNATPVSQQVASTDLGTALSNLGLRGLGATYTLSTSGTVSFTGSTTLGHSLRSTFTAVSAATTLGSHHKVAVNATTAPVTITLPTAASINGREYVVTKTDASANAVNFATTSSQLINGAAASTLTLTKQWQSVTLVSDGTGWIVMYSNNVHNHDAADITTGTLAIGRVPTGTSGTTVALGNHTHAVADTTGLQTTLDNANPWTHGVLPWIEYSGTAWPSRASIVPPGYSGRVIYLSAGYTGVAEPADKLAGDLWWKEDS